MSREPLIFRLPQDVEGRIRAYYQPRYNKKGELQECNIVQEVRSPALFFSKFMPSPEQKQLKLSFLRDFAQKMDTEELRKLVEHVRVRMEAQLCALQKALTSPPLRL
jgi:hypothetical protein